MARHTTPIALTVQTPCISWEESLARIGEATAILLAAKRRRDMRLVQNGGEITAELHTPLPKELDCSLAKDEEL